jgi:hypothetical protein
MRTAGLSSTRVYSLTFSHSLTPVPTLPTVTRLRETWECYRLPNLAYPTAVATTGLLMVPHWCPPASGTPHFTTSIHGDQCGLPVTNPPSAWRDFPFCLLGSRIYLNIKSLCLRGSLAILRNMFNTRTFGICQITIPHSYGRVGSFWIICERGILAAIISLRERRPHL